MILGVETVERRRRSASRGADGRTVITTESTTSIRASVQPITGRQREALPEGIRQRVSKKLYTKAELRSADQATGVPADQIVYGGETFEVVQVHRWPALLAHFEADLVRVTDTETDHV